MQKQVVAWDSKAWYCDMKEGSYPVLVSFLDPETKSNVQYEAALASITEGVTIVDIDFSNNFVSSIDEETGVETWSIKGAAGEMWFTAVQMDNTVADYSFALGVDGQLEDVLHVGGDSYGTVTLPGEMGDEDGLKVTFDLWYGQLGKAYQDIDFLNAAGERVAGFSYDSYNANVAWNEFDNESNTGMNIKGNVKSNHDKSGGAASVCTDALRNSFELNINYKTGKVQGSFVNSSKNIVGVEVDMITPESGDNKITTFRVGGRGHAKANSGAFGRRAWFDNLKIVKSGAYPDFEEDITESQWAENTKMGDANGDGVVDVADVVAIVNYILEKPADNFNAKAADVNGDNVIDAADVVLVVNIILDKGDASAARAQAVLKANGFIF